MKAYTVSEVMLKKMVHRYGERFRCDKCHKPFMVGDVIQSRQKGSGSKWYHQACYESRFIDVDQCRHLRILRSARAR